MGKTIVQDTDTHSSITMIEHYIPLNSSLINQSTNFNSPRSLPLCLIPCPGCNLNDTLLTNYDARIKCTINMRTDRLAIFNIYHNSSPEHKKFKDLVTYKYYISTKPLHLLRHNAYRIYLTHHNVIAPSLASDTAPSTSNDTSDPLLRTRSIIDSALLCDNNIKNSLYNIASKFLSYTNFQFYSDGSVIAIGTLDCKSGFGWIQTNPIIPKITFIGSTIFFPSSFKSESFAILTILLTLPDNSLCTIYTDSQNCIDVFNHRLNTPTISPRQRLKQNNFLIWDLIFWLISNNHLTIHLKKVRAHSNHEYNDIADKLAKSGCYSPDPILVNHRFFHQSSLGLINYNNIYVLERSARKWSDVPIQSRIFNMAINNSSMLPIKLQITHGHIDWNYTKIWINHNPLDSPTSHKLQALQSEKIKKLNFIYPTGNILQRNYPELYPIGRIKCPECNLHSDTNALIGFCPQHRNNLSNLLNKYKDILIELITINNDSNFIFDIRSSINASNLFKLKSDVLDEILSIDSSSPTPSATEIRIPEEQPWLLLLHHLIPIELSTFFYRYFSKKEDRDRYLLNYVSTFIKELNLITWSPRSRSFKLWEKSLNITSKQKKNYRRKRNTTRSTIDSSNSNNPPPTRRTRTSYTRYFHNITLPYSKKIINIDDSANIRWTTSNFLHSGTWESYRDSLFFSSYNYLPRYDFLRSP
ncbi:unnamed protein product [Rhizophagus irregularis]|nr:unnamed protein product [Rhizophagus irregularis]